MLDDLSRRVYARCVRLFFVHFFRLLLFTISVSQWGVLVWMVPALRGALPVPGHVIVVALIYATNRILARQTQRRRRDRNPAGALPHFYYAVAFTCLFCFAFLVLTGALWVTAALTVGAITVEARTAAGGLMTGSGIDTAFRWLANAGVLTIVVAFAYGYTIGQKRLRVTEVRLPLRNAGGSLHGVRIAQISDLHIGQNLDRMQLEHFVECVNALRPDLICITGDIADGPASDLATFLPVLAGLHAKHGVVAILGNHDHYAGAKWVESELCLRTPFMVLRDAARIVHINGLPLHVIGLDDRGRDWARGIAEVPHLERAMAAVPPDEPVLLLCHRPDVFPHAASRGVSLTLSGHTHGGQIGIPWPGGRVRNLAEFITAFDRGLYEHEGSYLYVNCGLGVTGQRVRLCTPREITLVEIEAHATRAEAA